MLTEVKKLIFLLPLLLYTLVIIWLAKPISFLSDDWLLIKFDSFSLSNLFVTNWHGLTGSGGFYRPLVRLSLYVNYLISGERPFLFHITNTLFHAFNSFLVLFLYREIFPKKDSWPPFLAAFLFFTLPIHTDNIFWIAGRTDTVCAMFFFLTIICYSRYLSFSSPISFIATGLCFWGALLSKEISLSLPGVLIIFAWYKQKLFKRKTGYLLSFVCISYIAYFFIRFSVLGLFLDGQANTNFSLNQISKSMVIACASIFRTDKHYLGIGIGMGIPMLTVLGTFLQFKNRNLLRDLLFMCALFFVTLIPISGLIARWYLYIPSAFPCIILTRIWLESYPNKFIRRIFFALFIGVLLYYGVMLFREGIFWRKASEISERTLKSVLHHIKDKRNERIFLVNVPSAYLPASAVGEKPIFAYNLELALVTKSGKNLKAVPVVVNHLLLLDSKPEISSMKRLKYACFLVECNHGGFFSFHTPEFVSSRLQPMNTGLDLQWGRLNIVSKNELVFKIHSYKGERILFFDGSLWSRL